MLKREKIDQLVIEIKYLQEQIENFEYANPRNHRRQEKYIAIQHNYEAEKLKEMLFLKKEELRFFKIGENRYV